MIVKKWYQSHFESFEIVLRVCLNAGKISGPPSPNLLAGGSK